jgi:serine/threonine protein kinase
MYLDLQVSKLNISVNLWNKPYRLWSLSNEEKKYTMVSPYQFQLSEIPFDLKYSDTSNQDIASAADSIIVQNQDCDDIQEFTKLLPAQFSDWLTGYQDISQHARHLIDKASQKDPALRMRIECEFHSWLKDSNNFQLVGNLLGIQSELLYPRQ